MQNTMKKIAAWNLIIFQLVDSLYFEFILARTWVGLKKISREAEISPMSANIRRTACHVKQPQRLLVQSPINPDTTVKPPTIMKSHPILLGTCSSAQITTMAAMPPIVARRFKTERRPVDTNATCPLIVLPAMIPADFQLHRPVWGSRMFVLGECYTWQTDPDKV